MPQASFFPSQTYNHPAILTIMSTSAPTDKTLVVVGLPDRETAFTARKAAFRSGTHTIDKFRTNWHSAKRSADNMRTFAVCPLQLMRLGSSA